MTTIPNGSQADQSPQWTKESPTPTPTATATATATAATVPTADPNGNTSVSEDEYNTSSALSCGPLVQLQVYGFCCPFIETEEEHDARLGVNHLQNYPITYYRKQLMEEVTAEVKREMPQSSGFMDGLNQLLGSNAKKCEIPMAYVGVPATLSIVDTDAHGPVIQIRTLEMNDSNDTAAKDAVNNYITSGKPWWENDTLKSKDPSKVVPLYMVDKVSSGWSITGDQTAGGVKLYAAPPVKGFLSGMGSEILRFDTLGGGGNSTLGDVMQGAAGMSNNEPNRHSDKVIVQLKSLIDWNRRRMARDIKHGKIAVAPKSKASGYVAMT